MEIYYKTKQMQKLCCDEAMMRRRLGAVMARKLEQRRMELSAALSLSVALHPQGPIFKTENGEIDRTRIKGIIITAIADTHQ